MRWGEGEGESGVVGERTGGNPSAKSALQVVIDTRSEG